MRAHLVDRDGALQHGTREHGALPLDGEAVIHGEQKRPLRAAWSSGHAQQQLLDELVQPLRGRLVLPCYVRPLASATTSTTRGEASEAESTPP